MDIYQVDLSDGDFNNLLRWIKRDCYFNATESIIQLSEVLDEYKVLYNKFQLRWLLNICVDWFYLEAFRENSSSGAVTYFNRHIPLVLLIYNLNDGENEYFVYYMNENKTELLERYPTCQFTKCKDSDSWFNITNLILAYTLAGIKTIDLCQTLLNLLTTWNAGDILNEQIQYLAKINQMFIKAP